MSLKNKYDLRENIVAFLVWPIFGLVNACFNLDNKGARFIAIVFAMIFGYTFIIPDQICDANAYLEMFQQMHRRDFSEFLNYIQDIFNKNADNNSEAADLFLPTLYYILSRFSDSKELLFLSFSLIFSIFIMLILKFLIAIYNYFPNVNSRIYIIFVSFLIPIFDINHFRWYVAFMTFSLGMFGILLNGNRKYIFLCLFSGIIHFSFLIFVFLIIVFYFLPKNKKIYYIILILSFVINGVLTQYINSYSDVISGSVQQRALSYSDDEYKDLIKADTESGLFILLQYQNICKYILLSILVFLDYKKFITTEKLNNIFLFSIFVLSITNLGSDIHSFSSRFLLLFQIAACLTLIELFSFYKIQKVHFTTFFGGFALLIIAIVQIRYGMPYISINLLLPFIGTSFFVENNFSLLDLIK